MNKGEARLKHLPITPVELTGVEPSALQFLLAGRRRELPSFVGDRRSRRRSGREAPPWAKIHRRSAVPQHLADKVSKVASAELAHDVGAMKFDRARANAERARGLLA